MPREVCRSFVKIIAEVLGSPPDLELLTVIFNFLLAVHPPTNTYICHNPTNFYFSLHIGRYNHFLLDFGYLDFQYFSSHSIHICLILIDWLLCARNCRNYTLGLGQGKGLQNEPDMVSAFREFHCQKERGDKYSNHYSKKQYLVST